MILYTPVGRILAILGFSSFFNRNRKLVKVNVFGEIYLEMFFRILVSFVESQNP